MLGVPPIFRPQNWTAPLAVIVRSHRGVYLGEGYANVLFQVDLPRAIADEAALRQTLIQILLGFNNRASCLVFVTDGQCPRDVLLESPPEPPINARAHLHLSPNLLVVLALVARLTPPLKLEFAHAPPTGRSGSRGGSFRMGRVLGRAPIWRM